MPKSPKLSKKSAIVEKKFRRNLAVIAMTALVIKVLIILRIEGFDWYQAGAGDLGKGLDELIDNNYVPPNAWYGADGENYIEGLRGLTNEGFFSKNDKLSYWPAGYPLLLWPLLELFKSYFFLALSILQSALYALGSIWFVDEIRRTRISKVSYLLSIFLALNPTISLNTISVGYELPVVALSLISAAALLRYFLERKSGLMRFEVFIASISLAIATFMQPRLLVIALSFFLFWSIAKFKYKLVTSFLLLTIGLVSIAPAILVFRNYQTHGFASISTNLGITMRLGAGPQTSGGYSNSPSGLVDCPETSGDPAEIDRALVKCVILWYLNNPGKSAVLFWNKARFFWSPWFGPEANGTMARNPWNKIHPLRETAKTQDGFNLIFGGPGKIVSWIWMLIGFVLLMSGFLLLWRLGDLERLLALISGSIFLLNLVSSMLTIGDHRFRVPSMALSLFLQAVGVTRLFREPKFMPNRAEPLVSWPILASARTKKR